ncbi:HpcH/HpaI aldolase/citrate lyase family protein [Raoultella sp. WB_B2P2-3]|uniref:HpcH/HpaI aldolase/citrate lyase family protein n=1 Tax=Raoultella scottii TaxID=3040937 RepID=A0ABU8Z136_9ENTR
MKKQFTPWDLGATLYMPATRSDLVEVVLDGKIPGLRSLVVCLEDAVSEHDVPLALQNLSLFLQRLNDAKSPHGDDEWPLVFIRPRHPDMGRLLTANMDLSVVDGFVLPKFTRSTLPVWWDIMADTGLTMMPTLETEEVYDVLKMQALASELSDHACRERIIALRIGGNDLMNVISLRRPRDLTLYDTPMGYVIKMLVSVFAPRDFALTAPVCEHIDDNGIMARELAMDIAHGLVGKTAIHPDQISVIEGALKVSPGEHSDALRILNSTQAVFKSQGAMCEPATHRRWAHGILARGQVYGLTTGQKTDGMRLIPFSQQQ